MTKKKNYFNIKNLKNVVFIGCSLKIDNLCNFNKHNNIRSMIICGSDHKINAPNKFERLITNKFDSKVKKFIKKNFKNDETLFLSIGSRYIFKKKTINETFKNKLINYHASRLPFDAGGGGWSWRIMKNDRIDNQLFHLVDEKIDTGSIIKFEENLFPKSLSIPKDFEEFRRMKFFEFYKSFILDLKKKTSFKMLSQTPYIGSYYPRLFSKESGVIDWNLKPHQIYYFINSFDDPFSGAITRINRFDNKKFYIKKVQIHGGEASNHPYAKGIVLRKNKNWIIVSLDHEYSLIIENILNSKGKNIIADIRAGDRLFTTPSDISKSFSKRFYFNSAGLIKK